MSNNVSIYDSNGDVKVMAALDSSSVFVSRTQLYDGTNFAAIKAASTAAVATDPALVVAISPNGPTGTGSLMSQGTAAVGATAVGNPVQVGPVFTTTPATLTSGQQGALQCDNGQNVLAKINVALPTGTNTIGSVKQTDGTNLILSGSATNTALTVSTNSLLTASPGMWSAYHVPAAATQATASKAAGAAGVRHVCTSISATVSTVGTAQTAALVLQLRDGATGAGTVVWSKQISLPVSTTWECNLSGLSIVGTAATAMCLEFSAANVAASYASVALTGYSCI